MKVWDKLRAWWRDRSRGMCPECGMDFADARRLAKLSEIDDKMVEAALRMLAAQDSRAHTKAAQDLRDAIDLRRAAQEAG